MNWILWFSSRDGGNLFTFCFLRIRRCILRIVPELFHSEERTLFFLLTFIAQVVACVALICVICEVVFFAIIVPICFPLLQAITGSNSLNHGRPNII